MTAVHADHFSLIGHPSIYHCLTSRGHQRSKNVIEKQLKQVSQNHPQKVGSSCVTLYKDVKQTPQQPYSASKSLVNKT
jgi:hypothetical protein